MTSAVTVADCGIDYSYSRPSLADGRKAGATFLIRYSAGAASDPKHPSHLLNAGKLITPREFGQALADGYDMVANSEWYESRITEKVEHPVRGVQTVKGLAALMSAARLDLGANLPDEHDDMLGYVSHAALADAAADAALWHSCGYATGASIYVSWDAAPVTSKWQAVDAYLHNYGGKLATLPGLYRADCYAGTGYLRHALGQKLIRFGWRPNAGSWSGDGLSYQPNTTTATNRVALVRAALAKTPAAIWQTGNYWFGKTADENLILRPQIGSHMQAKTNPTPKPTPGPTPYYHDDAHGSTALCSPDGQWGAFLGDDGKITVRKYDPKVGHGVTQRVI